METITNCHLKIAFLKARISDNHVSKIIFIDTMSGDDRVTQYLPINSSLSEITTVVDKPGFIVSHDYPFQYRSGILWCWDINFYTTHGINLILFNASFNKNQVKCYNTFENSLTVTIAL